MDRYFTSSATKKCFPLFKKEVKKVIQLWERQPQIQLSHDMFHLSIRIISLFAFGKDFENFEIAVETLRSSYEHCFHFMESRLGGAVVEPGSPQDLEFNKNRDSIFSLVQYLIKSRKEAYNTSGDGSGGNFIDFLLSQPNQNDDLIQSDIITVLIGGFHTSANFLTWALYFIARDKEMQQKLHSEIQEISGKEDPTFEQLSDLKYLNSVLNETLRYIVVAPYAARYSNKDEVVGGYIIPKKTMIMHALGATLHNPHEWNHPEVFDPSRFDDASSIGRSTFSFPPFGVGNRTCPGARFSMIESKLVVALLLQHFEFSVHTSEDITPVYGLVAYPSKEIILRVTTRF